MNKKEYEKLQEIMKESIRKNIQEAVNGKIDRLRKDVKEHKEEMQPIYDAYNSADNMGKFIIWIGKVLLALGIIGASIMTFIKLIK